MDFIPLNNLSHLSEIGQKSFSKTQIIFKHSTRCSVSSWVKKTLESEVKGFKDEDFDIYYLDLLQFRDVSNAAAEKFGVRHESPQILVIRNGKCVHHASHSAVTLEGVLK